MFPLLTKACIHFNSTILPQIVKGDKVVHCRSIGLEEDTTQHLAAAQITSFINYELLIKNSNWFEDTDKLMMNLPLMGHAFRKVFYDPISKKFKQFTCLLSNFSCPKTIGINIFIVATRIEYKATAILKEMRRNI